MKISKPAYVFAVLTVALVNSVEVFASSCRNYPKKRGVEVIEDPNGVKIISTAIASVPIDDHQSYINALEQAELKAKVQISRFMSENVSRACKKDTRKIRNLRVTNTSSSVDYEYVKNELCLVSTQTKSLLKGAKIIGSCYTPGKSVLVSVGIKPQTISSAKKLSNKLRGQSRISGSSHSKAKRSINNNEYQPGYSTSRKCTREEYREEYIPGTRDNPGTVRSWTERIEVPCDSNGAKRLNKAVPGNLDQASPSNLENNDCSQGSMIGALLGAGITMGSTRGKDRWWAVPAGGVAGSLIGCQIDGG